MSADLDSEFSPYNEARKHIEHLAEIKDSYREDTYFARLLEEPERSKELLRLRCRLLQDYTIYLMQVGAM